MLATPKSVNDFLYQLYSDASSSSISIECRRKLGLYGQESFIYGDSHLPSLHGIFNEVKPRAGEVFYDLGSGGGRLVLFAALSFPFAKCIGVELLDGLVNLSQEKLKLLQEKLSGVSNFDVNRLGEIEFIQNDFTKADIRDANVVYVAATCFDKKLMEILALLLEDQTSLGTRVITCTKSLASEKFKVFKSQLFPMEWGEARVFFHEKVKV